MRIHMKKVLWTTDLSDFSVDTLQYGINLAKLYNAKLYLCHVVNLPSMVAPNDLLYVDLRKEQTRRMAIAKKQLENLMEGKDVEWESQVSTGYVAEEIARIVEEIDIDLVICTTHARPRLRRLLLGSVTEHLMRVIRCPLMVLRGPQIPEETHFSPSVQFKKIMICCDFSPDATLVLEYGMSLAQEFQSEVHLVHVIEPSVFIDWEHPFAAPGEAIRTKLRNTITGNLIALVAEDPYSWCTPKVAVLEGTPDDSLTRYAAASQVELIVMGLRGQYLLGKLLVGSTTDRVIRSAPCPVMSVCTRPKKPVHWLA